jgi:alkanesulfonate monooxygenase SsuD/methylene tetrahydromethanopterin reductase-like flavin-dependent oxidoreductase (luciferase family)
LSRSTVSRETPKVRAKSSGVAMTAGRGYLVTMVNLYHDTMPKSPDAIVWPNPPLELPWTEELLDQLIEGGYLLCGTPEEVCEQVVRYQEVGCDQVVFGLPGEGIEHEEILEMLELFGDQVIPEFDPDPVHSTTRYREAAVRAFPEFAHPVPDVNVEIIPTSALKPLA